MCFFIFVKLHRPLLGFEYVVVVSELQEALIYSNFILINE
jgi:hypothetical protein